MTYTIVIASHPADKAYLLQLNAGLSLSTRACSAVGTDWASATLEGPLALPLQLAAERIRELEVALRQVLQQPLSGVTPRPDDPLGKFFIQATRVLEQR